MQTIIIHGKKMCTTQGTTNTANTHLMNALYFLIHSTKEPFKDPFAPPISSCIISIIIVESIFVNKLFMQCNH